MLPLFTKPDNLTLDNFSVILERGEELLAVPDTRGSILGTDLSKVSETVSVLIESYSKESLSQTFESRESQIAKEDLTAI